MKPDLRAWLVGFLLGCGGAGAISGSTTTRELVLWRGATVRGERVPDAVPLLEQAWQRAVIAIPGPEPAGWTVMLYDSEIPCGSLAPDGLCRGLMEAGRRQISVTWINGPDDVVAIAQWELCNYLRWATTGQLRDVGCGR